MNERLYDMNDAIIMGTHGETIGTLGDTMETFLEDDERTRAIIRQAYDETKEELQEKYPYTGLQFLFEEFNAVFVAKCRECLSPEYYQAFMAWWSEYLDKTIYAD